MSWFSGLFRPTSSSSVSNAPVLFTNTLTGTKEIFTPRKAGVATVYSCGPTVYSKAQIGNLRAYVFSNTITRVLAQAGYRVRPVINITDVGHLVSDADEGEDKMLVGATREGKSASEIADTYTRVFIEDIAKLGIDTDALQFPRASEYINEQIEIVQLLEQKGFTYTTSDGVYFDTAKLSNYGLLAGHTNVQSRDTVAAEIGRRITANKEKHHPADFALWRFSKNASNRLQEWKSPWGTGFPGWHIECSAMARALLGQPIDIHTGGIDHISVHHTNEMAQSEAAFGTPLARVWMHEAFLTVDGEKVSKSLGNDIYLSDIEERGYHPLALRYFFLQAHYRTTVSFSWEALRASDEALKRLWRHARDVRALSSERRAPSDAGRTLISYLRDDLATPQALALLWESLKDDELSGPQLWDLIVTAEQVLGLSLTNPPGTGALSIPADIQQLVNEREAARVARDFARADELRIHIESRGYRVDDGPVGSTVTKSH